MQSTENIQNQTADFSLIEITEILIKHQGLHEGLYNLSVQFQIAVGAIGPSPELICPGAMLGVSRIGISKTEEEKVNIHTVNAEKVNPAPKKRTT
ncbi:MAG: hypothetical protein Q7U64_13930 [Desulfocapsaceae bacterium]|jgi:hypothetical protein|nr:hypothetical protein [Desulfocapsaceae bacterium]